MFNAFPKNYIVWDLETNGFSSTKNVILEVAVAIIREGNVVDKWSSLINQDFEPNPKAEAIHGISREMCIAEGRPLEEVIGKLFKNIRDCEAHITHNGTRFDLMFLEQALINARTPSNYEYLAEKHIDTAALYKAMKINEKKIWSESWPDFFMRVLKEYAPGVKYNVGVCCDELGISREGVEQHRALADVLLTNEIYKKITNIGEGS